MSLRPYKFIVKSIPQIVDDEDNVVGEEEKVEPVVVYGCAALAKWADGFTESLAEADAARSAN